MANAVPATRKTASRKVARVGVLGILFTGFIAYLLSALWVVLSVVGDTVGMTIPAPLPVSCGRDERMRTEISSFLPKFVSAPRHRFRTT